MVTPQRLQFNHHGQRERNPPKKETREKRRNIESEWQNESSPESIRAGGLYKLQRELQFRFRPSILTRTYKGCFAEVGCRSGGRWSTNAMTGSVRHRHNCSFLLFFWLSTVFAAADADLMDLASRSTLSSSLSTSRLLLPWKFRSFCFVPVSYAGAATFGDVFVVISRSSCVAFYYARNFFVSLVFVSAASSETRCCFWTWCSHCHAAAPIEKGKKNTEEVCLQSKSNTDDSFSCVCIQL